MNSFYKQFILSFLTIGSYSIGSYYSPPISNSWNHSKSYSGSGHIEKSKSHEVTFEKRSTVQRTIQRENQLQQLKHLIDFNKKPELNMLTSLPIKAVDMLSIKSLRTYNSELSSNMGNCNSVQDWKARQEYNSHIITNFEVEKTLAVKNETISFESKGKVEQQSRISFLQNAKIGAESQIKCKKEDLHIVQNKLSGIYQKIAYREKHYFTGELFIGETQQTLETVQVYWEKVSNDTQKEIAKLENSLEIIQAKFDATQKFFESRNAAENKQILELQTVVNNLDQQGQLADSKLKDAVNLTVFDKGEYRYSAYNTLTPQAKELLVPSKISAEKFESIVACTGLQKHLFERTGSILNETAKLKIGCATDAQILSYIEATMHSCDVAIDMIKTGTPQEAIIATENVSALYEASKVCIGIAKGFAQGVATGAATIAVINTVPYAMPALSFKLAYDIYCAGKNGVDVKKSFENFSNLPLEQQAEKIASFVGSLLAPNPATLTSKLTNFNLLGLIPRGLPRN